MGTKVKTLQFLYTIPILYKQWLDTSDFEFDQASDHGTESDPESTVGGDTLTNNDIVTEQLLTSSKGKEMLTYKNKIYWLNNNNVTTSGIVVKYWLCSKCRFGLMVLLR